ncbi:MAG: hypothetical protein JRI80_04780 [Deltaproteobacteria bacterium]|nr:hypothetical protein [Deltaproteobacteria bacterium]
MDKEYQEQAVATLQAWAYKPAPAVKVEPSGDKRFLVLKVDLSHGSNKVLGRLHEIVTHGGMRRRMDRESFCCRFKQYWATRIDDYLFYLEVFNRWSELRKEGKVKGDALWNKVLKSMLPKVDLTDKERLRFRQYKAAAETITEILNSCE